MIVFDYILWGAIWVAGMGSLGFVVATLWSYRAVIMAALKGERRA